MTSPKQEVAESHSPDVSKGRKRFVPLENNPDVMSALLHKLGLSKKLAFHDVFSIDDPELLAFLPRPAHALLLVFPVSETYENFRREEDADREEYDGSGEKEEVMWYKQTIGNACGLIGVLHCVSNGPARSYIGKSILPT
jgi:ubiquitin carboxyl-terminal hydrolase L3